MNKKNNTKNLSKLPESSFIPVFMDLLELLSKHDGSKEDFALACKVMSEVIYHYGKYFGY